MTLPVIGTYWYGSRLGLIEQACLRSMLAQGHKVVLFTDDKVVGIPDGVEVCAARDVVGEREVIIHRRREMSYNSPALFANLFRYHALTQQGLIWVDTDVFLLSPLRPKDGYLVGWASRRFVNNAVLALPSTSPTLRDLIAMSEDLYPYLVPLFVMRSHRWRSTLERITGQRHRPIPWPVCGPRSLYWLVRSQFKHALGQPDHVSYVAWGVWGPQALTGFLKCNGEAHRALPTKCLNPIHHNQVGLFLAPACRAQALLSPDSRAIHLYRSLLRPQLGDGAPPPGSFLAELIASV